MNARYTEWRLAKNMTIVAAHEAIMVHERPAQRGDRLGTPVGCKACGYPLAGV